EAEQRRAWKPGLTDPPKAGRLRRPRPAVGRAEHEPVRCEPLLGGLEVREPQAVEAAAIRVDDPAEAHWVARVGAGVLTGGEGGEQLKHAVGRTPRRNRAVDAAVGSSPGQRELDEGLGRAEPGR